MGAATKNFPDVMTSERLRAHWFGGHHVPFWNHDPSQLMIGLEVEFFIGKKVDGVLELAGKDQYLAAMKSLVADSGYQDRRLKSQPGRVSKDTSHGFIAIKPDFAWHILEIALPPRARIQEIEQLLLSTFREVDDALAKNGVARLDMSCLNDVPKNMDLVELDRLSGFIDPGLLSDADSLKNLRIFPALIAATHVHVNCSDENSLRLMPSLYELEREALELFTRAKSFRGRSFQNLRSEMYEQAFGSEYKLRTIPKIIPSSIDEYVDQMNSSPKIFPFDTFFPARDMSYIRPTRYGTMEFRSSCSFMDVKTLLEIAAYRANQVLLVHGLRPRFCAKGTVK